MVSVMSDQGTTEQGRVLEIGEPATPKPTAGTAPARPAGAAPARPAASAPPTAEPPRGLEVGWPPARPAWWTRCLVAAIAGLTRTRLVAAAEVVSRRVGDPVDEVYGLFERTHAVLATRLSAADADALKCELAEVGVQVAVFDTADLAPCPPPLPVDELTWDDAGVRLRTPLGVHAVPWRDLVLGLVGACGGSPDDGSARKDPEATAVDLITLRWERFRLGTQPPPSGRARDPYLSPARLAGTILDRRSELARNEAFTALSIGQHPRVPRFADAIEHEAWTTLWLAHAYRPAR